MTDYSFTLNDRIVIRMVVSIIYLQHNVGPKTLGWRAIFLSKLLYFGSWRGYRVWQKSLLKDFIGYLTHNHLNDSSVNFLRPAAHCWYNEELEVKIHVESTLETTNIIITIPVYIITFTFCDWQ